MARRRRSFRRTICGKPGCGRRRSRPIASCFRIRSRARRTLRSPCDWRPPRIWQASRSCSSARMARPRPKIPRSTPRPSGLHAFADSGQHRQSDRGSAIARAGRQSERAGGTVWPRGHADPMTNAISALLSKQVGLRQQVDVIAHNVANLSTAGFKREDLAFATHVERLDVPGSSLALARVEIDPHRSPPRALWSVRATRSTSRSMAPGFSRSRRRAGSAIRATGASAPTSWASWSPRPAHRVLDDGGSPIFIPAQVSDLTLSADGTLSAPDGGPLGVLGDPRAA